MCLSLGAGIVVVDEDFNDVALVQDLAAFPGLIDDGLLIDLVGDGLPPSRGFFSTSSILFLMFCLYSSGLSILT